MIDVNVTLGRWPFRRVAGDDPAELAAKLRQGGVTQAWAGSFDGVFHKDVAAANARLAADCRRHGRGLLLAFGTVNPNLPDWREDLRRCEELGMPGIRLHPNYHGYRLGDSICAELMSLAAARKLVVQLAVMMEDERTQHPLIHVPPVDLQPLPDLVNAIPGLCLTVLNCRILPGREQLRRLTASSHVYFDFAMLESPGVVAFLAEALSEREILFGSNSPLFYFESAVLKVAESGLSGAQKSVVFEGNAQRLLSDRLRR